jgi:hypothetical protein
MLAMSYIGINCSLTRFFFRKSERAHASLDGETPLSVTADKTVE